MIKVDKLTKYFRKKKAVNEISFQVDKGEILGFLGPNGAGKSTTMRILAGYIPPTSGIAIIGGKNVVEDSLAVRSQMGYLSENTPVYPDMTVYGFLDFCAEIRGYTGGARKRRVYETIDKCFLADVTFQPIITLSKGFKQRVCFAQSIIHDPEYLILDEPTDGLDPNQKHEVRLMIREMSPQKVIILSTHILDEVDAVCSRAIIIANGEIVSDETPDKLRQLSHMHGAVTLTTAELPQDGIETLTDRLKLCAGIQSVDILPTDGDEITLRVFPESQGSPILDKIWFTTKALGIDTESIFVEKGRLDEVFRKLTT